MKKFFLFLLTVLCLTCIGVAAACSGNKGDYCTLVFRQTNGVTYVCDIPSGVEVRTGTEVKFSITLSDEAQGIPVVYKNDEVLEAENDIYSFVINENTVIKVLGIDAPGSDYNRIVCTTAGVQVTFRNTAGNGTLQNGMLVRNGTTVEFEVAPKESYYVPDGETPVVKVNGAVLTPVNNVYSFVMNGRAEITVENIVKDINVTFVNGDTRVFYFAKNGDELEADVAQPHRTGEEIVFDVKISSYYKQEGDDGYEDFEVHVNSDIIKPESDNLYHYTLRDDTKISVSKLTLDDSFLDKDDSGDGTPSNPFKISRPIDLYQLGAPHGIVNNNYTQNSIYRSAYYELTCDIDLQGEQLFIIGNAQNNLAYFAGHFDGKGHKITNFKIVDEFVEQENFQRTLATNVGMFGVVQPQDGNNPVIQNLTLEDYTVRVNASQHSAKVSVGSFVGMGYGVSIINCNASNGKLNVTGNTDSAYVGGIIGQQVSAYSDASDLRVEAGVVSCRSSVTIEVPTTVQGLVYAVGGISGVLGVGDRSVTSYVLNSYFTGKIIGGLNAGGIVGYASDYTSVTNCYSKGIVRAYSPYTNTGYNEAVYVSNAGGIVAELGYDAVVYGCFSASQLSATSAKQNYNSNCKTDPIAVILNGTSSDEPTQYGYNKALVENSHDKSGANSIDEAFLTGTLKWKVGDDGDWKMGADGYPVVNENGINKERTITVSFSADTAFGTVNSRTSSGYKSLAEWSRLTDNNAIPEYLQGNSTYRSYGYFFDQEHTKKVPLGFIPASDITLYIGSANYNDVAGTYYLGDSSEDRAMVVLGTDGSLFYRNVNISYESYYVYKGEDIVLYDTVIGELTKQFGDVDEQIQAQYFSYYYNFGAKIDKTNGVISIVGGYVSPLTVDGSGNIVADTQSPIIVMFPENNPLKGLKEKDGFGYGEYYSEDKNTVYGFNPNGSGYKIVKGAQPSTTPFTFAFEGDSSIKITYAGGTETAAYADNIIKTVNSAAVKPYDGFTGVWEAAFGFESSYEFDGMGGWKSGASSSGTYTVEGKNLTANSDFTAKINDDGFLEITKDGKTVTYYREGSLKGEWYFSGKSASNKAVSVNLLLNGLGEAGYGEAQATLSTGEVYDLNYKKMPATVSGNENVKMAIELYQHDIYFGTLMYDEAKSLLSGDFAGMTTRFVGLDPLSGNWISNNETLDLLGFNGYGFYNLSGDAQNGYVPIKGSVTLSGNRLTYTLNRKTMSGEFTYSDKKYTIKYNEYGEVSVTPASSTEIKLMTRDEWVNVELVDDNGRRYVFDGGGNLEKGGSIKVYNGKDQVEDGTYKIEGDQLTVSFANYQAGDGGSAQGTIKKEVRDSHSVYVLAFTDPSTIAETKLYKKTPFAGEWHIGAVRGTLTISNVYADNKATGSYEFDGISKKENVEFTYDGDGNFLSFTYGEGVTYYINVLDLGNDEYRLSFGPENNFSGSSNYTCIPKSGVDEYFDDDYYIYDYDTKKNIGKFVFDGLGKTTGNVTYYGLTPEGVVDYGKVVDRFTYTIATFGYGDLTYSYPRIAYWFYEYLLIPCDSDAKPEDFGTLMYMLRDGDSEHYFAVVRPDGLYDRKIRERENPSNLFYFDGVGGVTEYTQGGAPKFYNYEIVETNSQTYVHKLKFTEKVSGTVHEVELDQSADEPENWTIKFGS